MFFLSCSVGEGISVKEFLCGNDAPFSNALSHSKLRSGVVLTDDSPFCGLLGTVSMYSLASLYVPG